MSTKNLHCAPKHYARVNANTVHCRISNDFNLPVNKGRFVGRKLSGLIGDGDGRIELSNVNGAITIRRVIVEVLRVR